MDAVLLQRFKSVVFDTCLLEIVVWRVPEPVPGSRHRFKYRLFFGTGGQRIIGYDNERGKGDHKHIRGRELPYRFVDVETLLADFMADIENWRQDENLDD